MYALGANLQYLLVKHDINNNQLAKTISVGSSIVGKWIKGEITDLKLANVVNLATLFNTSLDTIVFGNIEAQDKLIQHYEKFEYVRLFEWDELIEKHTIKSIKIPSVLIHANLEDIFAVNYSPEYHCIFPSKSILLFTKNFTISQNDILLVRNKILDKLLFIVYDGKVYNSLLTRELIDIQQYKVEGVLVNTILYEVFFSL
jgi:hypothetical protein